MNGPEKDTFGIRRMNKLNVSEFKRPRATKSPKLIYCQNKSNVQGNDLQIVSPSFIYYVSLISHVECSLTLAAVILFGFD